VRLGRNAAFLILLLQGKVEVITSEKEIPMNVLRLVGTSVIACMLAVGIWAADEKDNAKMVVGKWKVVKASPGTFPLGTVLDLSKDDMVKVIGKRDDKEFIHEGTYQIDGAKIVITVKVAGEEQKHTLTITKINDTEMVTDHGGGGTIEFRRQ
jgi:uncharacterized protein (TIGR03066 family)